VNRLLKLQGEAIPAISNICYYSRDEINNKALSYIHMIISDSIKLLRSLEFIGIRYMDPQEAYETLASKNNTMEVDITKSTFFRALIEFKSVHNDDIIKLKLSIPYMDRFGRLVCNDIPYNIKPILTDNVLSPHASGIFMKLNITKTNISSNPLILIVDGIKENASVIYADMNRRVVGDSSTGLNRVVTPIAFYPLSTYGLMGMVKTITNADCKLVIRDEYEHNPDDGIYYSHNTIGIGLVIRIKERLDVIDNLMASIFYILSYTNKKTEMELYNYVKDKSIEDEKIFWIMWFGRFFYKGSLTYDKSTSEIKDHLEKVKNYLDTVANQNLKSIGLNVSSFIDLMTAIMGAFNTMVLRHKNINSDIEQSKKPNVLYYILNPVIMAVNSSFIEIAKREKTRNYHLSTKELEKILTGNITDRLVYSIVKSTRKNLAISLSSGCTDNLLDTLLTSDDQNRGDGIYVSSKNSFPINLRTITPVQFIIGSMHGIGKKAPTPLLKLSPFIKVDSNSQFIIDPELMATAKDCYKRMRSITQYTGHEINDDEESCDDLIDE
jgi:hypothetical protein